MVIILQSYAKSMHMVDSTIKLKTKVGFSHFLFIYFFGERFFQYLVWKSIWINYVHSQTDTKVVIIYFIFVSQTNKNFNLTPQIKKVVNSSSKQRKKIAGVIIL